MAVVDPERLGNVDLDVVDVVAVPDRLEEGRWRSEKRAPPPPPRPLPCRGSGRFAGIPGLRRRWSARLRSVSLALARSVPNGFSMMIRATLDQVGLAERGEERRTGHAEGGTLSVVQETDLAAADLLVSAADTASARPAGPALVETELSFFSEARPHWSSEDILPVAYWSQACRSQVAEVLVAQLTGGRTDDSVVGHESRHGEVEPIQATSLPPGRRVAPDSTMTCGCSAGLVSSASSLTSTSFSRFAGREPLASRLAQVQRRHVGAHDLGDGLLGQLLELAHPLGRLGQPLDVGPVRPGRSTRVRRP